MDRELKKRLTPEQYKELKSEAVEMRIREEVDRFIGNFIAVFKPAMRENRISDERADKIIMDLYERANERYLKGEKGEARPKDAFLTEESFFKTVEKVLEQYNIPGIEEISKELYTELINAGGGQV